MKIAKESKMTVEEVQQYLTFQLADEEYAISILKVKEILEYDTITTVPNTPKWICGVLNLRGSVVPVVDLAVKFGRPASSITKLSCIVITEIVCDGEKITMGVLTDEVSQVVDLGPGDIEEPPPFGTRMKIDYLNGMGRSGKKFCLILNIDKVLSSDELLEVTESFEGNAANALPGSNPIITETCTSVAARK
jgi:purine-binding chemotaxis protein CheW